MALPAKQVRFKEEYLIDLNSTKAAIRAGYSERTAYSIGQRLLKNVEIQSAIAEAKAARSERTEITHDRVVQELARLAFTDMADYATWGEDGVAIVASGDLPKGASRAVSEITEVKVETGGKDDQYVTRTTTKFKLYDKMGALDSLLKHLSPEKLKPGSTPATPFWVASAGYDINQMVADYPHIRKMILELDAEIRQLTDGDGIVEAE